MFASLFVAFKNEQRHCSDLHNNVTAIGILSSRLPERRHKDINGD